MMASVSASLAERTGHTLDEWVDLVTRSGIDPLDQLAVRNWLRDVHGVRQNSQWAIADEAATRAGWKRPSVREYVDGQYTGKKAALRPIYDAIEAVALDLGDPGSVSVEGRGGYTPFVRRRQFCAVAATTTRVDLGLRYAADVPDSTRLVASKGPGQSTHKVVITSVDEVDDEVRELLRAAYDQNG
jgi:hypothetical protein